MGDFNGDTRPDIITANQLVNNLTVALNTCTGPTPMGTLQFSAPTYSVGEGAGSVTVTVTRTGNTVGPASVRYLLRMEAPHRVPITSHHSVRFVLPTGKRQVAKRLNY